MQVFDSLQAFEPGAKPVVTMGTYDGVHLGHRAILRQLVEQARQENGESVVLTFHPHPRKVLMPEAEIQLLQDQQEKIERLNEVGVDKVLIIPFTKAFSEKTAEQFVEEVLLNTVQVHHLIIGYDHRFGKDREGGLEELKAASAQHGFQLTEIPAQEVDEAKVSSTKIRNALKQGAVELANKYLGYAYSLRGRVVEGQRLGHTIGFPTANIQPHSEDKLLPANGVYAVQAGVGEQHWPGMMNIGYRPTVDGTKLALEVHLLNFEGNLYGEDLRVHFERRIRDEQKFNSLDELQAQLKRDRGAAKKLLQVPEQ